MFSIDHILELAHHQDDFHKKLKIIHIAGTNGKGSTANYMTHILMEASYTVGLYTSPYQRVRFDNISINQHQISSDDIIDLYVVYKEDFEKFGLSEFEIDTFLALRYFYDKKVDYCVIEVGLGGTDDATNIVEPLISVITNIGLDHQDVLGFSYQEIALKKSGIIKESTPVVVGYDLNKEALDVIKTQAKLKQADFYETSAYQEVDLSDHIEFSYKNEVYTLNTLASYQIKNACLSIEIVHLLNQMKVTHIKHNHIQRGLNKPLLPYRFQIYQKNPTLILDGAHNLEGIEELVQSVQLIKTNKTIKIIFGVLKDKPYQEMYKKLLELSEHVVLTPFDYYRSLHPHDYQPKGIYLSDSIEEALKEIKKDKESLYIITGSLYFLREVHAILEEINL